MFWGTDLNETNRCFFENVDNIFLCKLLHLGKKYISFSLTFFCGVYQNCSLFWQTLIKIVTKILC